MLHGMEPARLDLAIEMPSCALFSTAHVVANCVAQELAKKTLLGSADMRLWVVQKDPVVIVGTPTSPSSPSSPSSPNKLLHNLSALDGDPPMRLGST